VVQLAIEDIQRDEQQPRRYFDKEKLEELAASIRAKGVIQPVLVRRQGSSYRIIAGERRWRAAQQAGLRSVPAIVREASEREAFELALIENLQRQDLNPVEEAEAYKRLLEDHELTQELVAQRVGRDRSTIANALRLLQLPPEIKESLVSGSLNMGHARALLGMSSASEMKQAAAEVIRRKLSVRATEGLVRGLRTQKPLKTAPVGASPHTREVVERLQRALGTRCRLVDQGGKGRIEVEWNSYEVLDRILERVQGRDGRTSS
jgi:ParB family chromosome partitioning protein